LASIRLRIARLPRFVAKLRWMNPMPANKILQHLKKHGEQMDTAIAKATGISLADVRLHLTELAAKGEIMSCLSIKYVKGKKIEGILCRISGYTPPAKSGAKPKVQITLS
jgi:hypothetical protein